MDDHAFEPDHARKRAPRLPGPAWVMIMGPAILFLFFSIVSVASVDFVVRSGREAALANVDRLLAINALRAHVHEQFSEARGFLIGLDGAHLMRMETARQEAFATLEAIARSMPEEPAREFVERVRALEAAHRARLDELIALRRREGTESDFLRRRFREEIVPSREAIEAEMRAFAQYQRGVLTQARQEAEAATRFTRGLLLGFSALSSVLILIGAMFLYHWFRRAEHRKLAGVENGGRFADIINHLDHSIVFFADAAPLRFHFVSERVQKLLGVSAQASLSNPEAFFDLVHPEDRHVLRDAFARSVELVQDQRCEHRMVSQEGVVRWFQSGVHPTRDPDGSLRLYGVMMEVTSLKKAQEEARRVRAQLEAMLDAAPSVIYMKDAAGRFLLVNRRFVECFSSGRAAVEGRTDFDVFPPEYARRFVENDTRVKETRQALTVEEIARVGDEERVFMSVKFPLLGPSGELLAVGGISTDVTEAKLAGEALAESESRHKELAKRLEAALRARDEVLAFVSHDLRNPLNVILMGTAFLESGADVDPVEIARRMRRSGERMDRMIGDILDMSRLGAGSYDTGRREIVGPELLAEVIEEMGPAAARAGVELVGDAGSEGFSFLSSRESLHRVLTNLVDNGIKFTPSGGRVSVLRIPDPHGLHFVVQDTGKGLTVEAKERVFDRFWQESRRTATKQRGLGLGLSIAKGIVESLGGRLWVESEPGHGAAFHFVLPRPVVGAQAAGAGEGESRVAGASESRFPEGDASW